MNFKVPNNEVEAEVVEIEEDQTFKEDKINTKDPTQVKWIKNRIKKDLRNLNQNQNNKSQFQSKNKDL